MHIEAYRSLATHRSRMVARRELQNGRTADWWPRAHGLSPRVLREIRTTPINYKGEPRR